jgi:hypothetical protein
VEHRKLGVAETDLTYHHYQEIRICMLTGQWWLATRLDFWVCDEEKLFRLEQEC